MNQTYRYNAFVSYYQSSDREIAIALQNALRRLGAKRYLLKFRALEIFRDETDTSGFVNLKEKIQKGIQQSEFLVLLASQSGKVAQPANKKDWVDEEIRYWIKNKHHSLSEAETKIDNLKIIICVTDGNIKWDDGQMDFDWDVTNCLPTALKGRYRDVPLWVDLRNVKSKSATNAEVLTLEFPEFKQKVAEVSAQVQDKSVDELIAKDRHYKRIGQGLVVAAVIALAFLSVLAVTFSIKATKESNEAIAQRNIADEKSREAARQERIAQAQRDTALVKTEEAVRERENAKQQFRRAEQEKKNAQFQRGVAEENAIAARLERDTARAQRAMAEKQRKISLSRELVLSSEKAMVQDPQLSLILGLQSAEQTWRDYHIMLPETKSLLERVIRANLKKITTANEGVEYFSISPDRTKIAVGSNKDDSIRVIDLQTSKRLLALKEEWGNSIGWSYDGSYLATAGQNSELMHLWRSSDGKLLKEFKLENNVMSVDWRHGYNQFAFALAIGDNSTVSVYDVDQDKILFTVPGMRGFWSRDGNKLATGGTNENSWSLRLYDPNGKLICVNKGHTRYVHDINWRFDNQMLVTASVDDQMIIWDGNNCNIVKIIQDEFPLTAAWSPDLKYLAGGGGNSAVKIWETTNYGLVDRIDHATTLIGSQLADSKIRGYILKIDWTPDGKFLNFSERDGSVISYDTRLINLTSDSVLLDVANSLKTRNLTEEEYSKYLHNDIALTRNEK